jgi:hypothetical protein
VLVLTVTVSLLASACSTSGDEASSTTTAATHGAFCRVLAEPVEVPHDGDEGDVVVFLDPAASTADRSAVEEALRASALVEDVRYLDRDASYAKFQDLFEGNEEMLANVRPEDLPTSFEVDLAPGWTDGSAAAFLAELRDRGDVYAARGRGVPTMRVFDVLVLAGTEPATATTIEGDLGDGPAAGAWLDQVQAAREEAEPEVADAINRLAATVTDHELPTTEDSTEGRRNAEAGELVAATGAARCDLHVPAFLTVED